MIMGHWLSIGGWHACPCLACRALGHAVGWSIFLWSYEALILILVGSVLVAPLRYIHMVYNGILWVYKDSRSGAHSLDDGKIRATRRGFSAICSLPLATKTIVFVVSDYYS